MKTSILLLASVIGLAGCDASNADLDLFYDFQKKSCHCILDAMPEFVMALNTGGANKTEDFCHFSAVMCMVTKSEKDMDKAVSIIKKHGDFQCNESYLEKYNADVANDAGNIGCQEMWTPQAVQAISEMANIAFTCRQTFGNAVNCDCVARKFLGTLTPQELYEFTTLRIMSPEVKNKHAYILGVCKNKQ
ncbi:MAG: hypothetical protein ACLRFP_02580 [Alphaproteobacteria bacterium]